MSDHRRALEHGLVEHVPLVDEDDTSRYERLLRSFRPELVGISALTWEAHAMEGLAETTQRQIPGVPVVVGGPHATAYPERCLLRSLEAC